MVPDGICEVNIAGRMPGAGPDHLLKLCSRLLIVHVEQRVKALLPQPIQIRRKEIGARVCKAGNQEEEDAKPSTKIHLLKFCPKQGLQAKSFFGKLNDLFRQTERNSSSTMFQETNCVDLRRDKIG